MPSHFISWRVIPARSRKANMDFQVNAKISQYLEQIPQVYFYRMCFAFKRDNKYLNLYIFFQSRNSKIVFKSNEIGATTKTVQYGSSTSLSKHNLWASHFKGKALLFFFPDNSLEGTSSNFFVPISKLCTIFVTAVSGVNSSFDNNNSKSFQPWNKVCHCFVIGALSILHSSLSSSQDSDPWPCLTTLL